MREENNRKTKKYLPDVRLYVTGASNVGKSAITVRFLTRRFIGEYQKNVEHTYRGFIDHGADTIKYDLRDSLRSPDKASITQWSTCIAVIYSITDQVSFTTASSILDDIDKVLHQSMQCNGLVPSIALIGNKKDLEHLRKVGEEDGRHLAEKHGAQFWEVSASEDYNSTFRPLNSLIVKSFLNVKNSRNSTPNSEKSSPASSGNETKRLSGINVDEIAKLLRRKSEPCYDTEMIKSINSYETSYNNRDHDDVIINSNNLAPNSNSPLVNTIKRRRRHLRENKRTSEKNVKKISPPTSSTPSTPSTPTPPNGGVNNYSASNITIEVTDTGSDSMPSPGKQHHRSQSWSKNDKKRVIHRKTTEEKTSISMPKSRSFSDLKTLVRDDVEERPHRMVTCKSAVILTKEDDDASDDILNENERIGNGILLKTTRSASTSSFSKFVSVEHSKNYWNKLKKDKRKMLTLSLEHVYDENSLPVKISDSGDKSPPNGSINGLRHIGKKSVRRKISSIFRPRSIAGSP